jgi:hypothetical protein
MKKIVLCLLLLNTIPLLAQVKLVTSSSLIDGDYYYVLPQNTIVFEGVIKTTTYNKGSEFISKFYLDSTASNPNKTEDLRKFGVDPDVYKELLANKTNIAYELKDVTIRIGASPDFAKIYKVKGKRSFLKNNSLSFVYGDNGMLLSGELGSESKVFDAIVKGLGGAVSILSAGFKGPAITSVAQLNPKLDDLIDLLKEYDEIILQSANSNLDIYKDKKIILEDRIAGYFNRLFYKTKETTTSFSIAYTPLLADSANESDILIFAFDEKTGTLQVNNEIKDKVEVVAACKLDFKKPATGYSVSISPDKYQFNKNFITRPAETKGFAYNVPAQAVLQYKKDGVLKEVRKIKLAQYGIVSYINHKQTKVTFELDPINGELKKIGGEGKSIGGDEVAAASTSVESLIKSLQPDSETTKLEAEFKLLELKKKIKDIKDLGIK